MFLFVLDRSQLIVALFNEDGKEMEERFMGEVLYRPALGRLAATPPACDCTIMILCDQAARHVFAEECVHAELPESCATAAHTQQQQLTRAHTKLILNISKLVPLKYAVKDSFALQPTPYIAAPVSGTLDLLVRWETGPAVRRRISRLLQHACTAACEFSCTLQALPGVGLER